MRQILAILLCCSALAGTDHNFELLFNAESGADGIVTPTLLDSGTLSLAPFNSNGWKTNGTTTNAFYIWTGYNLKLPGAYYWNGVATNDSGNRALAISMEHGDDTSYISKNFNSVQQPLSGCVVMVNNLTNNPSNPEFWDFVDFEDNSGDWFCIVQYATQFGRWRAHWGTGGGGSSGADLSPVAGQTIGYTNLLTWLITDTQFKVSLYEPFSHSFLGEAVGSRSSNPMKYVRIMNYLHHTNQAGITNFSGSLIIDTNGTYPLLPWAFVSSDPFIRVVSP